MPNLAHRSPPLPLRQGRSAWPEAVRAELNRRRALVEATANHAGGPVLDLAEPGALDLVLDTGRPAGPGTATPPAPGDRPYSVVVSVAALVDVADLPLALRGVERILDPDGRFLFVEPVAHPGWLGVMAASAGSRLAPVRGQHLARDVPLTVREAGFIITDIERFTMPTPLWPLRSFVHGCGRPRTGFAAR